MSSQKTEPLVLNVEDALQLAMRLHQDGRLEEAEHVYQEVLKQDPGNSSALHYLGILMVQMGQPEDGIIYIRRALANYPDNPQMHNHIGEAFRTMGRFDDAVKEYEHALSLDPDCVEVLNNFGVALSMHGDLDAALARFNQALAIAPDYAEAWNNKGVLLENLDKLDDAAACYAEAVKNKQNYTDAIAAFESVLRRLGTNSKWRAQLKEELESSLGKYEKLVDEYPDFAEPHNVLGVLLCERSRFEEGLEHYRKAVMLKPDFIEAINNIGVALHELEQPQEAIPYYLRALELRPDDPQIHCNLGGAYQETMNLEASEKELQIALELKSDYPEAHYNMALLQLASGRFSEGWRNYVWRGSLKDKASAFDLIDHPLPRDLAGKRIHLFRNQGIGDEVFFLRYAAELKRRNAWVSYRASRKMKPLVQRLACLDLVTEKGEDEPRNIDYRFSVADLPLALGMSSWSDVAPSIQLPVLPDALDKVKKRLQNIGPGPFVGVTWRAGTAERVDFTNERLPYKIMSPDLLGASLKGISAGILILQRHPEKEEIDQFATALGQGVHDFSDLNENLEEMLALLSLIDDYVGVSNTNVHLAAAAGKTVHILAPTTVLDWRWVPGGETSPWFPGFDIYRQDGSGSWANALSALRADLSLN